MKILTGTDAERIVDKSVPVPKSVVVKNPIAAIAATNKIKLPVVLKLMSSKAVHKTEVGGVKVVNDLESLRKTCTDFYNIAKSKKIPFDGIMVQEFVKGEEVLIGIKNDPTFGHVIAFGIGGKYTELLRDVSFRICPITEKDAQTMIDELRMKRLLYGFRSSKPVRISLLKKIMVAVSRLPVKNRSIEEMDINPLIINDKTAKAVDIRVGIKEQRNL